MKNTKLVNFQFNLERTGFRTNPDTQHSTQHLHLYLQGAAQTQFVEETSRSSLLLTESYSDALV